MPGPNSAPNGDSKLVHAWTTTKIYDDEGNLVRVDPITVREKLRRKKQLRTGKTAKKR